MTAETLPRLDIIDQWGRLNAGLIGLVDYIPDDKMNWSPREELYNFRGILAHTAFARHNWLTNIVNDGEETPDVLGGIATKDGIKEQLRLSWERVHRFLADEPVLEGVYERPDEDAVSGHWIAFHLLEHDIHHRSDIFHYLALLGIEHPEVETP